MVEPLRSNYANQFDGAMTNELEVEEQGNRIDESVDVVNCHYAGYS